MLYISRKQARLLHPLILTRYSIAMIKMLRSKFVVLPLAYLAVAIFLARDHVAYVYLSAAILVGLTIAVGYKAKTKPDVFIARWIAVLASIGLSAAVILSIEKIALLIEPAHHTSCSLSPIVACSPVIASEQASVLGFPNSFVGIFAFSVLLAAAMTILAGAKNLNKLWWRTLLAGVIAGATFCIWLFHEGVYEIGKLCLYCMIVWLVTFALLWLVTAHCIGNKSIDLGPRLNKLLSYKYELIVITYATIFVLLFYRWYDYWVSLF